MTEASVKFVVLLSVILIGIKSVVCPMFEEIAREFFSERQLKEYLNLIGENDFNKADKMARSYANRIFQHNNFTSKGEQLKSFLLHNVRQYVEAVTKNHRHLTKIGIDLHGLSRNYAKQFALKALESVEKLQHEEATKDKYSNYSKVCLITGRGNSTIGGPDGLNNKQYVENAVQKYGYSIQKTDNDGNICVILGESPILYQPPIKPPSTIPGLERKSKVRNLVKRPQNLTKPGKNVRNSSVKNKQERSKSKCIKAKRSSSQRSSYDSEAWRRGEIENGFEIVQNKPQKRQLKVKTRTIRV